MDFTPIIKKDNSKYTFKKYLLSSQVRIPFLFILIINIYSLAIILMVDIDWLDALVIEIFLIGVLITFIKMSLNHWKYLKYLNKHDNY